MALLNDIKTALAAVDDHVFYGTAALLQKQAPWDYVVFARDTLSCGQQGQSLTDSIVVVVVREDYVPDETIVDIIDAMTGIPGVRLSEGGHEYAYTVKPGTTMTVEQLVLKFSHSRKRL